MKARTRSTVILRDNSQSQRRELWDGDRLVAWIDAAKLTDKSYPGWQSEWMRQRWKPWKPFGVLR